jgi:hypothetical protein
VTRTKRSEPLFFGLTFKMNGGAAAAWEPLGADATDTARRTRSSPSFVFYQQRLGTANWGRR